MTTTNERFERETCSRCGGSGNYSYCQMYGSTCFKCGGKKEVLTKRGAAAMAHLKTLRSKSASELKIGDRVYHDGLVVPGAVCDKAGWTTVLEIRAGVVGLDGGFVVNGETVPHETIVITGRCKHCTNASARFRVFVSKEHEAETLAAALAYQATLTKSGTVRKVKV